MNRSSFLTLLLRAARPVTLAAGILLYALGVGIANYLGDTINWSVYFLGQGVVTTLQLSSFFLKEYFDRAGQPAFDPDRPRSERSGLNGDGVQEPPRVAYLQIAATTLTVGAVLTVLLFGSGVMDPQVLVILAVSFILALSYAMPPLRLAQSGYGELIMAILTANLVPALAFLLQAGDFHRLLAPLTFPITFLYLSATLALSLQGYMEDIRRSRRTMMVQLGWQRGMSLHNILIVIAYLLMVVSLGIGLLPWRLAWPAFLPLPVAIFQVWQINSIAGGNKPRWRMLSITVFATLALTVYFLSLALWTG